jgi:phytoene dehydrogenase-like protein
LRPGLAAELGLPGHGLVLIEPEPRLFAPLPDGRGLALWGDPQRSAASLAALSAKDARAWPEFHATLGRIAAVLGRLLDLTPPDLDRPSLREAWPFAGLALAARRLGRRQGQDLLRWGPMAVADFAQEWFETPLLQAVVAARGVRGVFAGPWSAGTTANLLLDAAAHGGHGAGATVLVRGGLGALSAALAAAARSSGAEVRTGAEVRRILTRDGRVAGLELLGGEVVEADAVASAVDLPRTVLGMLDPALLDPDDVRRVRNFRIQGMASKVHFALSGLPAFAGVKREESPGLLSGRIHLGADIDVLERAFDAAKYGDVSEAPWLELTLPSVTDPSLAADGHHVLSIYAHFAPRRLRHAGWPAAADTLYRAVMRALEPHVRGLESLVIARQVLTPEDLERRLGASNGHVFHGEPALDQSWIARPLLGWGRYQGPIGGLFFASAGTHPGGGLTGLSGLLAGKTVDRVIRK